MRLTAVVIALACVFTLAAPTLGQQTKLAEASQQVEKRIAESHAEVGVVFRTLDGKSEWTYHPDDSFHAASTMKVPVMIELFHQAKQGKVRLDETVTIRNEFHSIVDGSVYKLDPADDSESDLYMAEGQTRTRSEERRVGKEC